MLLKSRIIFQLVSLLIPLILCCNACQKDTGFPNEVIRLGTTDPDASISINFPGSATGSISLTVECQKYTCGSISLSGLSAKDSSTVVFYYPFRILRQYYPEKFISGAHHHLELEWKISKASLEVSLDSSLQTILLADNDQPVSINRVSIRNTSLREDSSDLKVKFTGSDLEGDNFTGDRVRIVAFGNSTTADRNTITGVYAQRLPNKLSEAGIDNIIFNEGIGGSHTGRLLDNGRHKIPHALDRFDTSVLARNPDLVIICFGLNDSWVDEGKKKSRISPENYRANLQFMIRSLKDIDVPTILMTPNAIAGQYEKWRYERSYEYAGIVRSIALEENIPLIDQWILFEDYASNEGQEIEDLLVDGMHPNNQWHEVLSDLLTNIIVEQLNNSSHE